jgi:hypothetical protein
VPSHEIDRLLNDPQVGGDAQGELDSLPLCPELRELVAVDD